MNLKRHTADQLARIAKDPMRAAFVNQLMRTSEHVTLESPNTSGGTSYFGSHGYGQFYGWAGGVQS